MEDDKSNYNLCINTTNVEIQTLLKQSIILLGITSVVMTICAEILAKLLASIFVSYDNNLLEITTNAIRIFSLSFIISGFNIFASSFFTALNNSVVSAIISFARTLVFQVIMILVLPILFGLNGIWFAVVVAEILALIVSVSLIIKNKKNINMLKFITIRKSFEIYKKNIIIYLTIC